MTENEKQDEDRSLIPGLSLRPDPDLAEGIPGLVRVAATSSWRTLKWAVGSTVRINRDIVTRTVQGEPVQVVLQDTANEIRHFAEEALGGQGPNRAGRTVDGRPGGRAIEEASTDQLRARGRELLQQSADVDVSEEGHPAYARILSELTPDEARILRFLYKDGPQPSIDIRTNRPFGIGSELVADGLSMIGEYAGLRHLDRIHPYMTNLFRLGLIDFSKEQVANPNRYQVIEAQPRMTEAMKKAGRAPKIVRRSIRLNSFGEEFCQTCLFGDQPADNGSKPTILSEEP